MVRMRLTKSKVGSRRSHHAITPKPLTATENGGVPTRRHHASRETGIYKGKKLFRSNAEKLKEKRELREKLAKEQTNNTEAEQGKTTTETATIPSDDTSSTKKDKK